MQLLDKLACCKKESVDRYTSRGDKSLCLLAVFLEAHTQWLSYHISHISRCFELQYFEGCDNEKCDRPAPAAFTCCRIPGGKGSSLKWVRKHNFHPSCVFDATCETWFIIHYAKEAFKDIVASCCREFFQIYVFAFSELFLKHKLSVERLFSKIFVLVQGRSFFKFTNTNIYILFLSIYAYYGWHSQFLV